MENDHKIYSVMELLLVLKKRLFPAPSQNLPEFSPQDIGLSFEYKVVRRTLSAFAWFPLKHMIIIKRDEIKLAEVNEFKSLVSRDVDWKD